mmetsp:Transcript_39568/g.85659  ORF Transcript_39568/g.85659 Transcript_39568/m.85659 type:complete len:307 (-) Transcript_39568:208-1128(-)
MLHRFGSKSAGTGLSPRQAVSQLGVEVLQFSQRLLIREVVLAKHLPLLRRGVHGQCHGRDVAWGTAPCGASRLAVGEAVAKLACLGLVVGGREEVSAGVAGGDGAEGRTHGGEGRRLGERVVGGQARKLSEGEVGLGTLEPTKALVGGVHGFAGGGELGGGGALCDAGESTVLANELSCDTSPYLFRGCGGGGRVIVRRRVGVGVEVREMQELHGGMRRGGGRGCVLFRRRRAAKGRVTAHREASRLCDALLTDGAEGSVPGHDLGRGPSVASVGGRGRFVVGRGGLVSGGESCLWCNFALCSRLP